MTIVRISAPGKTLRIPPSVSRLASHHAEARPCRSLPLFAALCRFAGLRRCSPLVALLPAGPVRIRGLWHIERWSRRGVGDRRCSVEHHLRDTKHVGIADVLRLVCHLVIVEMLTA